MGVLTDDMTRLHDEIVALHEARSRFEKGLRQTVSEMKEDFRNTRIETAKKTNANLAAFVSTLKDNVSVLRDGFAADIEGGRLAWFARFAPAERKAHAGTRRAKRNGSKAA